MRKSTVFALVFVVVIALGASLALYKSTRPNTEVASGDLWSKAEQLRRSDDIDGSQTVLAQIALSDPSNVEVRVRQAEILSMTDLEAARALVGTVDRSDLSESGRMRAVSLFLRLGEGERAREMLGPVSEDQPLSASLSLARAIIALQLDSDFVGARTALENVLRSDPEQIEAKQLLARILFQVGNVLDQIRAKSLARELDAVDQLPISLLGRMLFAEQSPLFSEEIVYFGERLLSHPDFETSPFFTNLEFYRVMARRFKGAGRIDLALDMERARRKHPDATELDLLSYLDIAMQSNRMDLVDADIDELLSRAPNNPRVDILCAARAHLRGMNDEAMNCVRRAMSKGNPSDVLVDAVRYIGAIKVLEPALEIQMAKLLLETEGIASGDVLIAANTVIKSFGDGPGKRAVVDDIKSRYEDEPAVLATWLRTQGLPDESLEQALRVLDSGNIRVLPLVVDLQCELGQIEAAETAYTTYGGEIDRFSRDVMGVRIAMARNDMVEAGNVWDGAWNRAQRNDDYRQMIALCHLAVAMQDYYRVTRSYDPLISNGIGLRREEFLFLASQEISRGRIAEARHILDQATVFFPEDTDLVNDRSYLSILLREGDYRTIDTMEALVKASPENNFYRFTLALAYLVNEFRGEAMETIQKIDFRAADFPQASRAIYAAVYWANGLQGPAQLVINQIDSSQLLEAERQILEPFLGKF